MKVQNIYSYNFKQNQNNFNRNQNFIKTMLVVCIHINKKTKQSNVYALKKKGQTSLIKIIKNTSQQIMYFFYVIVKTSYY